MKLRIDRQTLRFRVDHQEWESLREGSALQQETYLPNGAALCVSIVVSAEHDVLFLSYEKEHMTLYVSETMVAALLDTLPSRDGIKNTQAMEGGHTLQLVFEVDIRSQRRM